MTVWFYGKWTVVMISEVPNVVSLLSLSQYRSYPFGFQFAQLPCLLLTDFASNPVFPQLQSSKIHSAENT